MWKGISMKWYHSRKIITESNLKQISHFLPPFLLEKKKVAHTRAFIKYTSQIEWAVVALSYINTQVGCSTTKHHAERLVVGWSKYQMLQMTVYTRERDEKVWEMKIAKILSDDKRLFSCWVIKKRSSLLIAIESYGTLAKKRGGGAEQHLSGQRDEVTTLYVTKMNDLPGRLNKHESRKYTKPEKRSLGKLLCRL